MDHPDLSRLIAVVDADGHVHGSGYALTGDLVLTAAHVAAEVPPDRLLDPDPRLPPNARTPAPRTGCSRTGRGR